MNEDRKFKETQTKFLQSLPDILTRSPPEVCICQCRVQSPPMTVEILAKLLSEEEKSKVERFHFQRDRDRPIGVDIEQIRLLPEKLVQIYRIGGKVAVGWKL